MNTTAQTVLAIICLIQIILLALSIQANRKLKKKAYADGFKDGKAFGIGTEVSRLVKEGRVFEGPLVIKDINHVKITVDDAVFVRREEDCGIKVSGDCSHITFNGGTLNFIEEPS